MEEGAWKLKNECSDSQIQRGQHATFLEGKLPKEEGVERQSAKLHRRGVEECPRSSRSDDFEKKTKKEAGRLENRHAGNESPCKSACCKVIHILGLSR